MSKKLRGDWKILKNKHPFRYPQDNVIEIAEKDGVYSLTWKDKNEKSCKLVGLALSGSTLMGRRIPGHRGAFVAFYDVDIQLDIHGIDPARIAGSVIAASLLVGEEAGGGGAEGDLVGTWGAEAKPRDPDVLVPAAQSQATARFR